MFFIEIIFMMCVYDNELQLSNYKVRSPLHTINQTHLILIFYTPFGGRGELNNYAPLGGGAHRKVAAGRSSVSRQMASVFLSNNISLFTNFAQADDMIITSHSK